MKANELRIGNYYDHNGEIKQVTPNVITEVWESERYWCKAIPLSEEWLKKFGCKNIWPSHWETPGGLSFNFYEPHHCGLICFNARHVNFWFVHTFQNIISLTGEELTINQ